MHITSPLRSRGLGRLAKPALAFAVCGAVVLGLGACSTDGGGGTPTASGDCGKVPEVAPNDPNGIVAALPEEARAGFNNYPNEVVESAFADLAAVDGPIKVGLNLGANLNSYTEESLAQFTEMLEKTSAAGLTDPVPINNWAADASTASPTTQVAGYQDQVRQGAKLILIIPLSAEALIPAIEEAAKQGVVTVAYGGSIPSPYVINQYQNPYLNLALPTAAIAEKVGGTGDVLIVRGVSSMPSDEQQFDAVRSVLENCDFTIAGELEGGYTIPNAKTSTLQWLTSHPSDPAMVVQLNAMASGVISAFEQSGRPVPPVTMNLSSEGDVAYLHDNAPDGYYSVGTIGGGGAQVNASFRIGLRTLLGQGPKTSEFITAPPLITPDNVDDFYVPGSDLNSTAGIAGEIGVTYFPDSLMDAFFTNPAPLDF